jgi:hypothetical protein
LRVSRTSSRFLQPLGSLNQCMKTKSFSLFSSL